jgi:hypothetical protein
MSDFSFSDAADDGGERVIDRSGDIDQRPPDERSVRSANIVPFRAAFVPAEARIEDSGVPSTSAIVRRTQPAELAEIARRLQKEIDKQYAKAKAHFDALTTKIEAKEKRCGLPRIDDDLRRARLQRQKALVANGPELANHLREERSRLAELERFQTENRISRSANYPDSPLLAVGILAILVLVEACINGVLFADSSDNGLLGGWLEAMALAITNVGVAFLVGYIVLPQVNRRSLAAKGGAALLAFAGIAALMAVNLFGAHYRDFRVAAAKAETASILPSLAPKREPVGAIASQKAASNDAPLLKAQRSAGDAALKRIQAVEDGKRGEMEALRKVFAAPFELESFTSIFLLIIGLCAATIATADGYAFDDPFPGYGKRARRYADARAQGAKALRRFLNQTNGGIVANSQSIDRKLDDYSREAAELLALHYAYAGDLSVWKNKLDDAVENGEADIACHYRLLNKVSDRDANEHYALSAQSLPPLNEKHARFYKGQEKKFKELQKAVQKEKDESLGVFDAASADFEKLLAEAIHASLQTAPAMVRNSLQAAS